MTRYWQFLLVGFICLVVALLWAQPTPDRVPASPPPAAKAGPPAQSGNGTAGPASRPGASLKDSTGPAVNTDDKDDKNDDQPLPGSSSSLPLLAVIGFGVLAGGITSAMRTR